MSRHGSLKNIVLTLAIFAVISVVAGTAKADIVVVTGVNNQGTDNVLLNPATDVTTVTGTVGQNNLLVNFTSSSGSGLLNPTDLRFGQQRHVYPRGIQHQCLLKWFCRDPRRGSQHQWWLF
jgi:hypothetical protein